MTDTGKTKPELYRDRAAHMLKMAEDAPNEKLRTTYLWLSDDWNRRYFLEQASLVRDLVDQVELDSVRALYRDMVLKLEAMADAAFRARAADIPATTQELMALLKETLTV